MNYKDLIAQAKKEAWIIVKEEEVVAKEEEVVEEQKANEVMNTGATNFWTELIPTNVMADPLLDMLWNYSRLLPMLPWNHWNNMAISEKVPVIWEANLFQANSEWTTGAGSLTPANNWPMTDSVIISQWQFITTVDVSDRELTYATDRLEAIIRERINRAAGETVDAVLINGDSATSNNINWTYSAGAYYTQGDNGIRKTGISNTAVSVWTLTSSSYLAVKDVLDPRYQSELNDLLFIEPSTVYNKSLALSELITVDKFGPNATIQSGVLAKIWNIDVLVSKYFPSLTDSNGVVSTTSSNNTKGSFACIYKPAVQYWFGKPLQIEVGRVLWKGIKIVATFEFWFAIVNNKAWLWKTVWLWVNATV